MSFFFVSKYLMSKMIHFIYARWLSRNHVCFDVSSSTDDDKPYRRRLVISLNMFKYHKKRLSIKRSNKKKFRHTI